MSRRRGIGPSVVFATLFVLAVPVAFNAIIIAVSVDIGDGESYWAGFIDMDTESHAMFLFMLLLLASVAAPGHATTG